MCWDWTFWGAKIKACSSWGWQPKSCEHIRWTHRVPVCNMYFHVWYYKIVYLLGIATCYEPLRTLQNSSWSYPTGVSNSQMKGTPSYMNYWVMVWGMVKGMLERFGEGLRKLFYQQNPSTSVHQPSHQSGCVSSLFAGKSAILRFETAVGTKV